MWKATTAALAVVLLAGCQRGCLSSWLRDKGIGPAATTSLTRALLSAALDRCGTYPTRLQSENRPSSEPNSRTEPR